ncbi:ABC transporter transmembrane domain-containing protein [Longirhabdus pacifica]|uniref:ABC transporter transmembrane domain-containing protein n=1 Tax=Longirhabdus pacifica TaxID=2305227 RepID=UPI003522787F
MRIVKSNNAEQRERKHGNAKLLELFQLSLKEAKIQSIVSPIITSLMMVIFVGVIGYGGLRVFSGDIFAGTFIAIVVYLVQTVTPIVSLVSFYNDYKKTAGSTERVFEIYNMSEEKLNGSEKLALEAFENADVTIENVSFSYDQKTTILKNISMHIPNKKTTAIVGPSGSGKSTLFYLSFSDRRLPLQR